MSEICSICNKDYENTCCEYKQYLDEQEDKKIDEIKSGEYAASRETLRDLSWGSYSD